MVDSRLNTTLSEKQYATVVHDTLEHLARSLKKGLCRRPLQVELHVAKCTRALRGFDCSLQHLWASRPWLLYWCMHTLDLLGALPGAFIDTILESILHSHTEQKCENTVQVLTNDSPIEERCSRPNKGAETGPHTIGLLLTYGSSDSDGLAKGREPTDTPIVDLEFLKSHAMNARMKLSYLSRLINELKLDILPATNYLQFFCTTCGYTNKTFRIEIPHQYTSRESTFFFTENHVTQTTFPTEHGTCIDETDVFVLSQVPTTQETHLENPSQYLLRYFVTVHASHGHWNPSCSQFQQVQPSRADLLTFVKSCFRYHEGEEDIESFSVHDFANIARKNPTESDDGKKQCSQSCPFNSRSMEVSSEEPILREKHKFHVPVSAELSDSSHGKSGGYGGGPQQIPHLASSFAAVCVLLLLGGSGYSEAYDSIDRDAMTKWISSLRQSDGSFRMHVGGEVDLRASYCALAIGALLNLSYTEVTGGRKTEVSSAHMGLESMGPKHKNQKSGARQPVSLVEHFILQCQSYEGGFGCTPFDEAHGGYTYCALSSLVLLHVQWDRMHATPLDHDTTINFLTLTRWIVSRQSPFPLPSPTFLGGLNGRTNKLVDSCYTFWVGSLPPLRAALLHMSRKFEHKVNGGEYDTTLLASIFDFLQLGHPTTQRSTAVATLQTPSSSSSLSSTSDPSSPLLLPSFWNTDRLLDYVLLGCQNLNEGGFWDTPGSETDYYHTCYALSGLSVVLGYPSLQQSGGSTPEEGLPALNCDVNPLFNLRRCRVAQARKYFDNRKGKGRRTNS